MPAKVALHMDMAPEWGLHTPGWSTVRWCATRPPLQPNAVPASLLRAATPGAGVQQAQHTRQPPTTRPARRRNRPQQRPRPARPAAPPLHPFWPLSPKLLS